jgi:ferrous iron transport protein A
MLPESGKAQTAAQTAHAARVEAGAVRLSQARPGDKGVIVDVRAESHPGDPRHMGHGVTVDELQRRLLEFGFVEGAHIEVLHEGAIRRDPIAVKLDDMRVALRRRDAEDVWIRLDPASSLPAPSSLPK